ncbi:MAG: TIR domain-containing protein [Lentilitoribacter sp.]
MRVFLSHSSKDKAVVEAVAAELRPGSYELDSLTFDKGGLNAQEIMNSLQRSDLFCLFLSKHSEASHYVRYEQTFAQELLASGQIKRVLTVCLDDETFTKYKGFMKHFNMVRKALSPASAARLIEGIQLSSQRERNEERHPFLGRDNELKMLQDQAIDHEKPLMKGLFIAGNAGAGRRTISKKFYQNQYPNVRASYPQVLVDEFDGYDEFYRKIILEIKPKISFADLKSHVQHLSTVPDQEKAILISEEINQMAENNETLIVYDGGGLLQDNGALQLEFENIVNELVDRPHPPAIFISPRMTRPSLRRSQNDLAYLSVGSLSKGDSKRLLGSLLKEKQISVNGDDLNALNELSDQHPFNIYRIVELVVEVNSAELFAANPIDFNDWKHKHTSEYVKSTSLSNLDRKILSIFQIVPELDFKSLCTVLEIPSTQVSGEIQKMIDLHLVGVVEDRIAISPALRIAIQRDSRVQIADFERTKVLKSLSITLSARMEDESGPISLIDSTILVELETGKPTSKLQEAFLLPSHNVWLAKNHYDDKRWHDAIEHAKAAVSGRARLSKSGVIAACRYLALAAARINDQDNFKYGLSMLKSVATDDWAKSNVHFLEGFNSRLSGHLYDAQKSLLSSYELSKGSRSTARELASVCLELNDPEQAEKYAREAYRYAKQNPFLIDILISCLIHTRKRGCVNDPEVKDLLDSLEILDQLDGRSFYFTRKAEIEYLYGSGILAQKFVDQALTITPRLFEPLRLKAQIYIKLGQPSRAKSQIDALENMLRSSDKSGNRPHHRPFVFLQTEYHLEVGEYEIAQRLLGDARFFTDEDRAALKKNIDLARAYKQK